MKILEAKETDLPSLIELNSEVQELHINWNPEKFKKVSKNEIIEWLMELLNDKTVKVLIAFMDSKAVGYAIAKILKREGNVFIYPSQFIEIDQIAVTKKYRNKNVGKKLVEEIKNHAQKIGINTLSLSVLARNSNAIKAYTNMGFEPEGIKMIFKLTS
jgi:ribosomal protein S18 acetylase RimI-like enzyme